MCGTVSSLAYSTAQPCVLSLRCYRVSRRNGRAPLRRRASAPSSHPLPRFSFTNPKHRFGFDRKNEEADMEFSAFAGNGMQRVHSDAGKKWGNRLDPWCGIPLISRLRRQLPPEGEAFGRRVIPSAQHSAESRRHATFPAFGRKFFVFKFPQLCYNDIHRRAPKKILKKGFTNPILCAIINNENYSYY